MARCLYPMVGIYNNAGRFLLYDKKRFIERFPRAREMVYQRRVYVQPGITREQFERKNFYGDEWLDEYGQDRETVFTFSREVLTYRDELFSSDEWKLFRNPFNGELMNPIRIPCGKCAECRLNQANEKANRLVMENLTVDPDNMLGRSWFLTLTYANDQELFNMTWEESQDLDVPIGLTLKPEHADKFIKDLRNYWKYHYNVDNIRFFLCGEYGGKSCRPHFHAIVYNLELPDAKLHHRNFRGDCFFESEILSKIWGHGFIAISSVNWETCAYTARYVLKKFTGDDAKNLYAKHNLVPTYQKSSTHPGIGYDFLVKNKKTILEHRQIVLPGGRVCGVPRYFERILEKEDLPALFAYKAEGVQRMLRSQEIQERDQYVYMSEEEYFLNRLEQTKERQKKLIRHKTFS